jgi:hypothetical protein
MKTYKITYCYGGRFLGDKKYTQEIKANSREEALKLLNEKWNVEEILHIEEVN